GLGGRHVGPCALVHLLHGVDELLEQVVDHVANETWLDVLDDTVGSFDGGSTQAPLSCHLFVEHAASVLDDDGARLRLAYLVLEMVALGFRLAYLVLELSHDGMRLLPWLWACSDRKHTARASLAPSARF